jgi:F420-dependent oxidoreductase-like protein
MLDVDGSIDTTIERATRLHETGFRSMRASQIFGPDTLTVLAVVGRELDDVDFGTAVVPIQPRHPSMLAAQARTMQEAIKGTLSLDIGLSHQVIVEGLWGISFDKPASYMREYLEALEPTLRGASVNVQGTRVGAVSMSAVGPAETRAPGLPVAALGPKMLHVAGTMSDGTVVWKTGRKTIASHIVPLLREEATTAGRPEPRVVCGLPITVTSDVSGARGSMRRTQSMARSPVTSR